MNALIALLLTLLGCGALGMVGCLIARDDDVLPPPNKATHRDVYQEFQP